eukprot:CAMPEP_0113690340 /NCGR_PEP_ID=MMETSP0038_2-20120614/17724_1 /TAXON_ID=2898 /ORGANISM="Cryptomonas paramecium" /LENGTH=145 /DNA_ID=CAMNT_0000611629 /DNA_START=42 /DNA_END=479 /DNA_ORIENTATION=+ /assembly_acc=CAM_ASM_000170
MVSDDSEDAVLLSQDSNIHSDGRRERFEAAELDNENQNLLTQKKETTSSSMIDRYKQDTDIEAVRGSTAMRFLQTSGVDDEIDDLLVPVQARDHRGKNRTQSFYKCCANSCPLILLCLASAIIAALAYIAIVVLCILPDIFGPCS